MKVRREKVDFQTKGPYYKSEKKTEMKCIQEVDMNV